MQPIKYCRQTTFYRNAKTAFCELERGKRRTKFSCYIGKIRQCYASDKAIEMDFSIQKKVVNLYEICKSNNFCRTHVGV